MTHTCALEKLFINHQEKAHPVGIWENCLESSRTFQCVPSACLPSSTMGRCCPISPVRRDAHFGEVCARKGKLLEMTSTLSVESKISLCPLQIISSEKHWRIACPCKISQGGCFNDIPAVWRKKRQKEECHQ